VAHQPDERRMKLRLLLAQQRRIAERRQRRNAEALALPAQDSQRRGADGARRAEDGNPLHGHRGGAHTSRALKSTYETGSTKSRLSNRSSTPPCPGMMCELSFMPASRLSSDSARSPICAATLTRAANATSPPRTNASCVVGVKRKR